MGLGREFLRDLITLRRAGELEGARRVAEIGAQQLADSLIEAPEMEEACRLFGAKNIFRVTPVGDKNFTAHAPPARPFWSHLGLDHASVDVQGGTVSLDLNRDTVPEEMRDAFDLVINAGTTEHVSNQENAFRVIHDLTKPGGIMYHEVPAGGMIDHGFFSYQPKFFARMAYQNDYEVLLLRMSAHQDSAVPQYLRDFNERYGGNIPETVTDYALRVAMRRCGSFDFATPVDVEATLIPRPQRTTRRQLSYLAGRARLLGWRGLRSLSGFRKFRD
jgi:SAM-dependent methyltransferase